MLATDIVRLHNINGRNTFPFDMEDCVLYLPLGQEDMQGSTIISYDQYHHSCAVTGATWSPDGRTFAGAGFITITSALTQLAATTKGTFNCWIEVPDATPAANMVFFGFGDTDANTHINLKIVTTGVVYATMNLAGGLWTVYTNSAALTDATSAMVTVVQNGIVPVLYINGVAPAQTSTGTKDKWFADAAGIDNGFIGKGYDNTTDNQERLTGTVREIEIWTRDYSAGEVKGLYRATK